MAVIALMYHDVVTKDNLSSGFQNESAFQYKVDSDLLEEHLKKLEGEDVVLTFDDGGVSFYTEIAPLLEKYGRKGVFFIATSYIDTPGFLTKEQIRELHNRGGHIIGSHSHTHPHDIASFSTGDIFEEWETSSRILESITGKKTDVASIPNGACSDKVLSAAIEAGITTIYTSEPTTKVRKYKGGIIKGRYVIHNNSSSDEPVRIVKSLKYRTFRHCRWTMVELAKMLLGPLYGVVKKRIVGHDASENNSD